MKLVDFTRLKIHNTRTSTLEILGRVFPQYLMTTFLSFLVITPEGQWTRLVRTSRVYLEFIIKVGVDIQSANYSNIARTLIDYFEDCYSIQKGIKYYVVLGNQEKKDFIELCTTLDNKPWNNIISSFCEGLNTLTFSGKVNNISLYGDE